jgi:adenylate cyclase
VAPEIASRIVSAERAIGPGDAEVKTASVMFCDIEGFSGLAERLPADRPIAMLNEYFEAVSAVVDSFGGVITQYQGDAILITFNAARPNPRHAESALRTALSIQQVVGRQTFGPGLRLPTRCGINTGEMVTGAVGTPERLYFTVYGDNVNIAARLEQLNKKYGTYVLATAETVQAAGGALPAKAIGTVAVRGRQAEVDVYAFDPPPPGDPQTEMLR